MNNVPLKKVTERVHWHILGETGLSATFDTLTLTSNPEECQAVLDLPVQYHAELLLAWLSQHPEWRLVSVAPSFSVESNAIPSRYDAYLEQSTQAAVPLGS